MINVIFVNKTSKEVTDVKMDYIANPQCNCTVMYINTKDSKFRECSIWKEGSVTSAQEIAKFCNENSTIFDSYVCDGKERKTVAEYWPDYVSALKEEEEEDKEDE